MSVYDPRVPAILAWPYPSYEAMREAGQVVWSDVLNGYLVLGHAEISEVLRSRHVSAAWIGDRRPYPSDVAAQLRPANAWLGRMMLFADPPEHARMRTITTKAFTPRMVEDLRPTIERLANELIDAVADRDVGHRRPGLSHCPAYLVAWLQREALTAQSLPHVEL